MLARSKSHLFMLSEASEINDGERRFLHERGWMTLSNKHGDILIGSRVNDVESSMKRLAGSAMAGVAHEALPCSYMMVEIVMTFQKPASRRPLQELVQTESESVCSTSTVVLQETRLHWRMRHWELCMLIVSIIKLTWLEATPIWHFIGPQGVSRSQWTSGEECTRVFGTISLKPGSKSSTDSVHVLPKGTTRFCKQFVPSQAV